jgi:hypothetical protein
VIAVTESIEDQGYSFGVAAISQFMDETMMPCLFISRPTMIAAATALFVFTTAALAASVLM